MNALDVRDYLEDGERLLWESKPKPFHIIEGSEGRELMFVWAVSLFWLYMIMIYRLYNGMNTVLLVFLIMLLAWISLNPVATYFRILRQHYCLTSRRALVVNANGASSSMELKAIENYRIFKTEAKGASLAMGDELLAENGKQLRYRALHPVRKQDSDGKLVTSGIVFYHAERVDEAARLLEKMSRQQKPSFLREKAL